MKIISLFNNKGGVGKSTLAFHLSHALAEMGHKTLMIDLDPQCNLTICGMDQESLHEIWMKEDDFIEDFEQALKETKAKTFQEIMNTPRSIHFLLKPSEDGSSEPTEIPPPVLLKKNLDLIPGRLTIHKYENKISERWSGAYTGDPLAIRTITSIRNIAERYANKLDYEYIIIDTSPSLGILNKVIISTVDGFLIPAQPDMFSLYGIRNIGNSLSLWSKEFNTMFSLISEEKRKKFPQKFVRFLGYTIYNAKKYSGTTPWDLATAHYNYAKQIPGTVKQYINNSIRNHLSAEQANNPIGDTSVMHSHNTLPSMAQKYHCPIWEVPDLDNLDSGDSATILGNADRYYRPLKTKYRDFANCLIKRISTLD